MNTHINNTLPRFGRQPEVWKSLLALTVLIGSWAVSIWIVDPRGEFMINDDWAYVRCLEALVNQGRIIDTGWAGGGLALISQLLWGGLFTSVFGFSVTVIRGSVLTLAVLSSISLWYICRSREKDIFFGLVCVWTIVFNPLFYSLSYSFMTDIPFVSLAVLALSLLHFGVSRESRSSIILGLAMSAAAILVRQFGLLLTVGFIAACWLTPQGRLLGPWRYTFLALVMTAGPWLGWEWYLKTIGSTPVTDHQLFGQILGAVRERGLLSYAWLLFFRAFVVGLGYTALLTSPFLVFHLDVLLRSSLLRRLLWGWTGVFIVFELSIITGLVDPPVFFYRNTIVNFGLGPLLFKDTYILGNNRLSPIRPELYYFLVFIAVPAAAVILVQVRSTLKDLFTENRPDFTTTMAFFGALAYLGVITLTGFHDRYVIPLCVLTIIWLAPQAHNKYIKSTSYRIVAAILLIGMTGFTVAATHDFMATRRAAHQAHLYLLNEKGADPCRVDGGFEFNGYHCHDPVFQPKPGLSWWWVHREDYVVTLGPLDGYRIVRQFPIGRYLGRDGAVHVLQPVPK